MEMTMRIRMIITTLLLMTTVVVSAQELKTTVDEDRKAEIREMLALDYSMPDYSISKIDEKVMGHRLATILKRIMDCYNQNIYKSALSVIQSNQVEGLSYGCIKSMKLDKVIKQDNEITILFNTMLEGNNLNIKKSHLVFSFINGVSDDVAVNDFFTNICRYTKE